MGRSIGRVGRSPGRSIGQSIGRSIVRSIVGSVVRSVNQSVPWSAVGRSVCRSIDRSISRSVGRSHVETGGVAPTIRRLVGFVSKMVLCRCMFRIVCVCGVVDEMGCLLALAGPSRPRQRSPGRGGPSRPLRYLGRPGKAGGGPDRRPRRLSWGAILGRIVSPPLEGSPKVPEVPGGPQRSLEGPITVLRRFWKPSKKVSEGNLLRRFLETF